jgi:hydrogenase maturation protease
MTIALIGIGQSLRGDDGAGPETVRLWSRDHPQSSADPNLHIITAETPGLELLELIRDTDAAILVDAAESGEPAGTVRVRTSLPAPGSTPAEKSAHGFGVAETLALAGIVGARLPARLVFITVEGSCWDMGTDLSDPVRRAIPGAVREIQNQMERWSSELK